MSSTKVRFVWGSGGVGKSHLAIREAYQSPACLLMTLDPSYRLFDLLELTERQKIHQVDLNGHRFQLMGPQIDQLFDQLHEKQPASPQIREYYFKLVEGLHRFREYLALLQLADQVQQNRYEKIIVDTPPFQEAMGLHQSLRSLETFFNAGLVQFALKSSIIYKSLKKIIYLGRTFVGKRGMEEAFAFIQWLSQNVERFQKSSQMLGKLLRAEETEHSYVMTPESPLFQFEMTKGFFKEQPHLDFCINRSATHFKIPDQDDAFCLEMKNLQEREREVVEKIQTHFPQSKISRIPLQLMGSDSREELIHFIESGL